MDDPDAEARIPPALGEDESVLHLDPVPPLPQRVRDRVGGELTRSGGHLEPQPDHVVEPPLRVAHEIPDAGQPLE